MSSDGKAPPALLLMGHGTRLASGVNEFWEFTTMVSEALAEAGYGRARSAGGFIEFAEPNLDDAVDGLVIAGESHIVAVPVVLLAAGHLKNDGPALLKRARSRHPGVSFSYARDFGVNPVVLDVAAESISATVKLLSTCPPSNPQTWTGTRHRVGADGTAAVIVGRGSTDPDANADLFKIARLLGDNRGLPLVEPAFVSLSPPSVGDALDRTAALGASKIAVVPYFLFSGVLSDRIADQAEQWAKNRPGVSIVSAPAIGPEPRLADLAVRHYIEAATGPVAMNCDCCIYRASLPGYESRLG